MRTQGLELGRVTARWLAPALELAALGLCLAGAVWACPRRSALQFAANVLANDPSMDGPVVYVGDLGERNSEVVAKFPGRSLYRWDAERGVLVSLGPDGVQPRIEP